jgi:hypothetical protein
MTTDDTTTTELPTVALLRVGDELYVTLRRPHSTAYIVARYPTDRGGMDRGGIAALTVRQLERAIADAYSAGIATGMRR